MLRPAFTKASTGRWVERYELLKKEKFENYMNKISVTINILFLTISYSTTILSMTIDNLLQHKDIEPLIINKLYKEDIPDIRLVCKKWASRRSDGIHRNNWYYMPDSIE